MNGTGILLLAIIGGYLYFKTRAVIKLTYRFGGVQELNIFRSQIQFKLNVIVFNPSNTSVTLDYAQINLTLKNSYIGKCILQNQTKIQRLGEDTVQIFCSIGLLDLVQAIPDIIGSIKTRNVNIVVSGIVGGEGVKADINIPLTFTLPKIQNSLNRIKLTENEKYEFVKGSEVKILADKKSYKITT